MTEFFPPRSLITVRSAFLARRAALRAQISALEHRLVGAEGEAARQVTLAIAHLAADLARIDDRLATVEDEIAHRAAAEPHERLRRHTEAASR